MRCLNCGKELAQGARFCSVCGTAVMPGSEESENAPVPEAGKTTHIPKKKRSSLRTILILAVALSGVLVLTNILHNNNNEDELLYGEPQDSQEIDPEWQAKQEQIHEYGIDLSMYDEHGEWSNDRMWVRKTEKAWDSVAEYFGYLDRDGNLVGEWHPVKQDWSDEYNYRDLQEAYMVLEQPGISEWEFCRDFVGGFALNSIGTYQDSDGMYTATYCPMFEIVNKNGEIVHSFIPLDYAGDWASALKYEFNFVNYLPIFYASTAAVWNADGSYAGEAPAMYIIFPEGDDVREVLIEGSTGENGFYNVRHFYSHLSNREFINGYCAMISSFGDRAYLFDKDGKTAFQVEFDYRITKLYANDDVVYMQFIGADEDTTYEVEMDWQGNWLKEPVPVD